MCHSTTVVHRNGSVIQNSHKVCKLEGRCHLPFRSAILLCCICLAQAACVCGSNCSSTVINVSEPLSPDDFHAILDTLHIDNGNYSAANISSARDGGENSTSYMTLKNIMHSYGIDDNSTLSAKDFSIICPTIIQQQLLASCENTTALPEKEANVEPSLPTVKERYGFGTLAVVIINYLPMVLLAIIPDPSHWLYPYIMNILIALATSTLICDATMHLIPECLGLEEEENESSGVASKPLVNPILSKLLLILCAIYGMYLLEMLIGTRQKAKHGGEGGHGHSHGGGHGHSHGGHSHTPKSEKAAARHSHSHSHEHTHGMHTHGMPPAPDDHATHSHGLPPPSESAVELVGYDNCVSFSPEDGHAETDFANGIVKQAEANNKNEKDKPASNRSIRGFGIFLKTWAKECIPNRSFGWMIITSDSLHNMMDGIAIGAAFSKSPMMGIATSLAIFFHEIPHEIGDFAALLTSGLTWRGAFTWHVFQTLTAFVGLFIGLGASTDDTAQQWIFALTAGVFFHVSLGELLPELHNITRNFWAFFLLQNVGIAIGFAIMFVIAVYETNIENAFN